jgi:hypothetical protein
MRAESASATTRFQTLATAFLALTSLWVTFVASGCQTTKKANLPKVVAEDATTGELCDAINANSAKIQSIYATNASIGVQNQPGWANCRLLFDRPNKLRLVGTASLMGRVVDCGCDGEQFWFWSSFQNPDELYYCKIDEYQGSALSDLIPVDPTWFPEAFGIVEIQEDDVEDRTTTSDGQILLTVKRTRNDGVYRKRIYVEPQTAAIERQDVQDPNGDAIISVIVREQQYLSEPGVVLPKKLEIRCETTNDTLLVDVGAPTLNDPSKFDDSVFKRPTDIKATAVDIGVGATQAQTTAAPATTFQSVRTDQSAQSSSTSPTSNVVPPANASPASTQPSSDSGAETPAFSSNNPGLVPFPSSVASQPPPPRNDASSVTIEPTRITSTPSPYAVVPEGGPQVLPSSDSPFAQRILNPQELQNAQSAIVGVPPQTNQNVAERYSPQTDSIELGRTASNPNYAPQAPAQRRLEESDADMQFQPYWQSQPVANTGAISAVGADDAAQFQPSLAADAQAPQQGASQTFSTTPPVTLEDPPAPAAPENLPLDDEFPTLLPF